MAMQFQQIGRLAWWQGQELRARDLREQANSIEQLRWWHNRGLHGSYGVSQRLSVTTDAATPALVTVDCGLAYDCFGRELVLASPRTITLPAPKGDQFLVLSYARSAAVLKWIARNDFAVSHGVPLALFEVNAAAYLRNDTFHAPAALALSRPRIAAGATVPGNTRWEKLPGDVGLKVVVDTSAAGFTKTPFYLATLNWLEQNTDFSTPLSSITDSSEGELTLTLLLSVAQELLKVASVVGLVGMVGPDPKDKSFSLLKQIGVPETEIFQRDDLIVRLLPQAQIAVPINSVSNGKIELTAALPDGPLKQGELVVFGSLPVTGSVVSVAPDGKDQFVVTVSDIGNFRQGDLVGIGKSPAYRPGIIVKVDPQSGKLTVTGKEFAQDAKDITVADFPTRSTALTVTPLPRAAGIDSLIREVTVGDLDGFHVQDVVARLDGTKVLGFSALLSFPAAGVILLSDPKEFATDSKELAIHDVIGVARFSRTGQVLSPVPLQPAVRMRSVEEANFFRSGDTVADLNAIPPLTLAVVEKVVGDTVFFETALPDLGPGHTLGIVALNACTQAKNPITDARTFSVESVAAARDRDIAARVTGWVDASSTPVRITQEKSPIQVDSLPAGLRAGDAIGFAALSAKQPVIRFEATTKIQHETVNVNGIDEKSGKAVHTTATPTPGSGQRATLAFPGGGDFVLRPESVQITVSSRVDDFLAYAQRNGLNVCWLGCQMPIVDEIPCPGLVESKCGCR
jgi:hypothetical protein